jgi:hypothetical protein
MKIALITSMLTAVPMLLPTNCLAQTPQKGSTLTIVGHAGEAKLFQLNGKSYVDIETLARLTGGTLLFKSNQTILTVPISDRDLPASMPHVTVGVSRAFTQAGIEEISVIREWRFHHLRQRSCETGNFHFAHLVREIDCIVESCRRLGVPIRQYLLDVLPGLADRSIQSLTELTPTAYAAKMAK